uniref:Uncharacterized protein n=1 Tax=Hordeum vulgare subsp. vulgare TaxID=112509 RepID=A0A8I6YSI8_HORVV
MAHCKTSLAAFIFSSSTDQWLAAPSKDLSGLALDKHDLEEMSVAQHYIPKRHYAYGCFYWDWVQFGIKKLLLLDTTNMEFSTADLPPGEWSKQGIAIVEAGEGRLGMFGFHSETSSDLSYTVARNKGESPSQWQMEKTMSLDSGYKYCIRDATQRYFLFTRVEASTSLENRLVVGYFSMDIKTLQLQRVYEKQYYSQYQSYTYINFPPSLLSSRRI